MSDCSHSFCVQLAKIIVPVSVMKFACATWLFLCCCCWFFLFLFYSSSSQGPPIIGGTCKRHSNIYFTVSSSGGMISEHVPVLIKSLVLVMRVVGHAVHVLLCDQCFVIFRLLFLQVTSHPINCDIFTSLCLFISQQPVNPKLHCSVAVNRHH